ncbi:MAG: cold-shock protein [Candidatus Pacebacteria bacterium]|nr:cold-shock protein [Candidatus Paceibacterota bacterium]
MSTTNGNGHDGELIGMVSWFSNSKGFGFIKPNDGSEDVFVHISAVQAAGQQSLRDGTTITCEIEPGRKGRQVAKIVKIDESTATGSAFTPREGGRRNASPDGNGTAVEDFGIGFTDADRQGANAGEGSVKWFNLTKGFGFISPSNGGRDVFLHASVVRRAGLHDVMPGQKVSFYAIDREKGPEARTIDMVN